MIIYVTDFWEDMFYFIFLCLFSEVPLEEAGDDPEPSDLIRI